MQLSWSNGWAVRRAVFCGHAMLSFLSINTHWADAYADATDLFPSRQTELLSYSEMLLVTSFLVNISTALEGLRWTCSDAFVAIDAEVFLQPPVGHEVHICNDRDQAYSSAVFR